MSHRDALRFLWPLLIFLCLMSGCSNKRLLVIDTNGNPVPGAEVIVKSASANGEPSFTDKMGLTTVNDPDVQFPTRISIRKEGVGSALIAYPGIWPAEVTLRPGTIRDQLNTPNNDSGDPNSN
ncbi:MAG: hypothetical protein O7G85_14945 [Planctomycetota bacterium]|nr:hypothetical protein [Planctomycetota bacterium]